MANGEIAVVVCADEQYAMPLCTMGASLLAHLDPRYRVRLFVIHEGESVPYERFTEQGLSLVQKSR